MPQREGDGGLRQVRDQVVCAGGESLGHGESILRAWRNGTDASGWGWGSSAIPVIVCLARCSVAVVCVAVVASSVWSGVGRTWCERCRQRSSGGLVTARALLWSLALALFSSGCTHSVHQLSLGGLDDIPPGARLRPVQAEADQSAFLAAGDTEFADRALALLSAKCPRGRVVGIEARYSTSLGFLSYTNRMRIAGYCLDDERESSARTAAR